MDQIEKKKKALFGMMEELADIPLSRDRIRDLDTLMGAYKALCLVCRGKQEEAEAMLQPNAKAPVAR